MVKVVYIDKHILPHRFSKNNTKFKCYFNFPSYFILRTRDCRHKCNLAPKLRFLNICFLILIICMKFKKNSSNLLQICPNTVFSINVKISTIYVFFWVSGVGPCVSGLIKISTFLRSVLQQIEGNHWCKFQRPHSNKYNTLKVCLEKENWTIR